MNIWQTLLLVGCAAALWHSKHMPRAWAWIVLGMASFAVPTAWQRYGMPRPEVFGSATNVIVWLAIYHYGRRQWEVWFAACFQAMVAVNVLTMIGDAYHVWHIPNYWRVVWLEIFNWSALAVIWTAASTEVAEDGHYIHRSPLHRALAFRRSLHRQRKDTPFTHVP